MATCFLQKRSTLEADREKAQEDYWGFNVESNDFNSLLQVFLSYLNDNKARETMDITCAITLLMKNGHIAAILL